MGGMHLIVKKMSQYKKMFFFMQNRICFEVKYDPDMFLTGFARLIYCVWKCRGVNATEALGKAHNDDDKTWQQKTTSLQYALVFAYHLLVNKTLRMYELVLRDGIQEVQQHTMDINL